eukprot:1157645-Pelagomonas_calceolata.AAC.8
MNKGRHRGGLVSATLACLVSHHHAAPRGDCHGQKGRHRGGLLALALAIVKQPTGEIVMNKKQHRGGSLREVFMNKRRHRGGLSHDQGRALGRLASALPALLAFALLAFPLLTFLPLLYPWDDAEEGLRDCENAAPDLFKASFDVVKD